MSPNLSICMSALSRPKSLFCFAIFCSVLFAASLIARPTQADSALLRIGKIETAPTIDGIPNDPAWANSITVSDFNINGGRKPAIEETQVKLAYDNDKLYIAWHCRESLLTVAQQRMHEVRTNVRNRDGDVLNDDSVIVFLRPPGNEAVYEFNLNSAGTLFDAQSTRGDLWKARDASWNANAESAAVQEDGYWTAELALPWQTFRMKTPPATDTVWEIGLARRAVGRGESSSWHDSDSTAIHSISQWGQLVFADTAPAISARPLTDFEAGTGELVVQISNSVSDVTIEGSVSENNKKTLFQKKIPANRQVATLNLPVIATGDALLWQWLARNDDGKVLYRSPQILLSAQSTVARLKISTQATWTVFVNETKIAAGNAVDGQEISIPLTQGVNDVQVEVESGSARLELLPPGFALPQSIGWRMAAATPSASSAKSSWVMAPQQNGVAGKSGSPVRLRHTLLWKATPYYPKTDPALYIAQGTAQSLTFIAEGVEGIRFEDWQAMLAVPRELEVLGSSAFYGKQIAGKTQFHTSSLGPVTIEGQEMQLYRITANKPLVYKKNQHTLLITFEALLRWRKGQQHDSSKEWPLYYWTQGNKNTVSEAPQSINIRTAPQLRGKQPKKLVWEFWTSGTHVYDDRELLRNILDTSRQAGFNKYQASSWKDFNDMVREYGMKTFALVTFNDGRTFDIVRPFLIAHPEQRMIDKTGKPLSDYMCTTQLLGDNWHLFAKSIQDWLLQADLDAVEYDYEYPPFNPPHACFCNRCLSKFRTFAKLAPNAELSLETIQKDLTTQWIDFMAYRTAILLGKMKKAVHEANPKVKFTSYSGYYDADNNTTKSRYGIDWNIVGQMQAIDEAGMGYGRPVPGITDSVTALRGIPVKYGELLVPYDIRSERPVAPLKKATLLRRALDATGGVLIYQRKSMDGRSWYAVGETTRLVADYEDLFIGHRLETIPGQDPAKVQILKGDTRALVCIMNETSKPAHYEFSLPVALGKGREYYSGKTVTAGAAIKLTLEPGEAAVYVLQTD